MFANNLILDLESMFNNFQLLKKAFVMNVSTYKKSHYDRGGKVTEISAQFDSLSIY